MSIVVTATSGHLGRLVVRDLLERRIPAADVVAGARNLDAITDLADAGVRTAAIDYNDPATIETAITPGDVFVLISSSDLANKDRQHADAIAAAARASAGHLIYTSGLRAAETDFAIAASHALTEEAVRGSGLPFTILRNGWYTENYERNLPAVRESGVLLASVGDGRVASATRADLAAAAGVVAASVRASESEHVGATYELSGDVAWTYTDLAAALSDVLSRDVTYQPVTAEQHVEVLTGAGVPEQFATMMVAVDAGLGAGGMAYQNGDLARLLGRPTTPLVDGLRPLV